MVFAHTCWQEKLSTGGVECGEVWMLEVRLLLRLTSELDSQRGTFQLAQNSSESRSFWLFSRELCLCKPTRRDLSTWLVSILRI